MRLAGPSDHSPPFSIAHNSGMAIHRTPEEIRQHYVETMGEDLGAVFYDLWNDCAGLHLKWNEFVALFGKSAAQFRLLNSAAPGFFGEVEDIWWDALLLHLSRLTDTRKDVLSVHTLLRKAPVGLHAGLKPKIDTLMKAVAFARDARHRIIAHRNIDVALKRSAKPLSRGSRNDIRAALKALDDLLHFIEHHYCHTEPTHYEYLEPLGGVSSLIHIIERGLRDRDREIENL
jgi:AbiU2